MGIRLDRAIQGFLLHLRSERRSQYTIRDYSVTLGRLVDWCGPEAKVSEINTDTIRQFLDHWSGAKVQPNSGIHRPARKLSAKTLKNMHTALSSFWTFLVHEDYVSVHVLRGRIQPPKAAPAPIEPYTDEELKKLLEACERSGTWDTQFNGPTRYQRPTAIRDRAIILFLLDTGCRASELCNLTVDQVSFTNNTALVTGKGDKRRELVFSPKTGYAVFRYLGSRDQYGPNTRLFQTRTGKPFKRDNLLRLISRMGERAGVPNSHPHRFRHTFAIKWLRNGGDIYTLQAQLGHSSLDMVKRYLKIAGSDVRRVHRRASPVENLI